MKLLTLIVREEDEKSCFLFYFIFLIKTCSGLITVILEILGVRDRSIWYFAFFSMIIITIENREENWMCLYIPRKIRKLKRCEYICFNYCFLSSAYVSCFPL